MPEVISSMPAIAHKSNYCETCCRKPLGCHTNMKPYFKDLRTRIVKAVREGMSNSEAARLFGVILSSVKRYVGIVDRVSSLESRKGGGRLPSPTRSPRGFSKKTYTVVRRPPSTKDVAS